MSQQPPNYPQPPYGDQSFGRQSFGSQSFGGGQQQPTNYPPQQPYEGQPQYGQPSYYPSQQQPGMYPPQQPPKKKNTGRNAIIAVVVIVVLLAACGGIAAAISNANKSANTGTIVNNPTSTTGNTQPTSAPAQPSTFKVGQTISVGGTWQITVVSAKTDTGSQFNTPQKPGDVFLVVTIAVKNISSQSQTMSSALQWTLQDSTGQKYDFTIDANAGSTLDGAVAVGAPLKGVISYEVPKSIHAFTLNFQNDITSSDQSTWNITV